MGVTWYEAEAFCLWLTATNEAGLTYRLPTEVEWERLARGEYGRVYPWGNTWADGECNTKESGLEQSSPVGLFPAGISPTGAYDCAGNVWEWCLDGHDEKEQMFRVLRGGSWRDARGFARCAARIGDNPRLSYNDYGFRVVSPIF